MGERSPVAEHDGTCSPGHNPACSGVLSPHSSHMSLASSRSGTFRDMPRYIKMYEPGSHLVMDSAAQKTNLHMSLALMRAGCHIHWGEREESG